MSMVIWNFHNIVIINKVERKRLLFTNKRLHEKPTKKNEPVWLYATEGIFSSISTAVWNRVRMVSCWSEILHVFLSRYDWSSFWAQTPTAIHEPGQWYLSFWIGRQSDSSHHLLERSTVYWIESVPLCIMSTLSTVYRDLYTQPWLGYFSEEGIQ